MWRDQLGGIALSLCLAAATGHPAEVRDEGARLVVRTARTTLVLDKQAKGAIRSLVDDATGQDYRDCEVARRPRAPGHVPASVFAYLYHEFVPCFQSNPRAGDERRVKLDPWQVRLIRK